MLSNIRFFSLPNDGISTNPARKVPNILPTVDKAYRLPTVDPDLSISCMTNFTEYGDTIPRSTLGIANKNIVSTMAAILISHMHDPTNCSTIKFVRVVIAIKKAALNIIDANIETRGFL